MTTFEILCKAVILDADTRQLSQIAGKFFSIVEKAKVSSDMFDTDFTYDSKFGEMKAQLVAMGKDAVDNMTSLASWFLELKEKIDGFPGDEEGSMFNKIQAPSFLDKLRIAGTGTYSRTT